MGSVTDPDDLVGLTADERLLSQDPVDLPSAIGRPPAIPVSSTRGRLVGVGAVLTGVTLLSGLALAVLGVIELVSGNGVTGVVALVLGLGLAATHWGWVHVAELTADAVQTRHSRPALDERRRWLQSIAPFDRHEVLTRVGDDGSITIERVRHRPVPAGERHFAFTREVETAERHTADEPAAQVTERAELLRRRARADTERAREHFEAVAADVESAALRDDDDEARRQAQVAASRALSEQINSNLREPPLVE